MLVLIILVEVVDGTEGQEDCPKDLSKTAQKGSLNVKDGMMNKGGRTLINQ